MKDAQKWNEEIPDELILSAGSLIGSYSFNEISASFISQLTLQGKIWNLKIFWA